MIHLDDLDELAEDLRKLGFNACHEFLYGPRGCQEGLEVGEDFFPLSELNLPENRAALETLDFATIKARRGAGPPGAPPRVESQG